MEKDITQERNGTGKDCHSMVLRGLTARHGQESKCQKTAAAVEEIVRNPISSALPHVVEDMHYSLHLLEYGISPAPDWRHFG